MLTEEDRHDYIAKTPSPGKEKTAVVLLKWEYDLSARKQKRGL